MLVNASALVRQVIGCAIAVHSALGPGLLESIYQQCLARELAAASLEFQRELRLPLTYRDAVLDAAYRVDFVVGGVLLLE